MNRESRAPDIQTASRAAPDQNTPAAFFEAGLRLLRAGQFHDAEQCGRQALALDARHADSLHLMGLLAMLAKQPALAVEWFAEAIRQNDNVADYFFNLAHALKEQGRLDEAIKSFDRGLTLQPGYAEGWYNLGELLQQQKRLDEAIMSYDMALKAEPSYREAANAGALLYFETRRYEQALARFTRSAEIAPNQPGAFNYISRCHWALRQFDDALASGFKAIALAPDHPELNKNLGLLLQKLDRHEEAIVWLGKALALRPDFAPALNDLSTSLFALRRIDEAFAAIDRAIAVDPECADYPWNKALLQLLLGDFAGWRGREWGRKSALVNFTDRKFTKPQWFGEEPIAGKTILLHSDEGFGDTIQFARYAALVARRGARVILEVQDPLHALLSDIDGVSLCLPKSADALPDFDLHCPLSGLPLAFKTELETIPAAPSYLPPLPEARCREWQARLGAHDGLRVGLVWSGNPDHSNDRSRSTNLQMMSALLDPRARFYSLQKEPRPEDQATLAARCGIVDLTAHLTDFVETAALISCLDLVVTVDTSVAHLAAALGRPTWILLPFTPDYRWLLDRDDSPWYPSVRLFRQDERRDYAIVLQRVREELQSLIAAFKCDQGTPTAYFEAGLRLLQAGRLAEAEQCGRQALALDAAHADSLHLMGLLSLLAKQPAIAVEWFAQAIRQNGGVADYFFNLAHALKDDGRIDEAIKSFDRGLTLQPGYAEGWCAMGELLEQQKRFDEAIMSYDKALSINPSYREAANASGLLYFETRRYETALARFKRAAEIDPSQSSAFNHISRCHWALRQFEAALAAALEAIALAPGHPELTYNVALLLQKLDRHEEAIAWFDKALALRPDFAAALNHRSTSLLALRRIDEAFAAIDRAIAIDPGSALYRLNKSHLQLLTGDFRGWEGREWGRKCGLENYVERTFARPQWFGEEPIAGKTILLHGDEGYGDTIQFVRYAPRVAARGARVILEVQDALHALLSDIKGVSQCLPKSAEALPEFDLHCPLSALPLAFNTQLETIPAAPSYLPPLPQARVQEWQARIGAHDGLRVGLVWSGSPTHGNDRSRSTTLRAMFAILDPNARFYSLQKEPRPEDRATLAERTDIIDLTAHLTNFVETAALISCLDLVITVDTSVAHLAAALGRPTWILLPFSPDFRWLLDREDSPWYPTVRLFRQDESHDYAPVLERVRAELGVLISSLPAQAHGSP